MKFTFLPLTNTRKLTYDMRTTYEKRSNKVKSRNLLVLLYFSFLAVTPFACSKDTDPAEVKSNKPIPAIGGGASQAGKFALTQRLSGVVRAKNQVAIYPEISAVITDALVTNGESVVKGQELIRLRDKEFRERLKQATASYQIAIAQRKQAEAQLKEIESELHRMQTLAEKQLASAAELETMQTRAVGASASVELAIARVEQAQANVEEQQENLSQTVIRAPIAGSIGNRNAEVGMLVNQSTRLFTIGQLDNVRVDVVLTDRMLNYIEEGNEVKFLPPTMGGGPSSAPVARISPFLHPVTHSTDAEIDLPNPDRSLKPGMFVTVDIFYGESEQATLVPLSALYEHPIKGVTGVWVTTEGMNREPVGRLGSTQAMALTEPMPFKFVPVEIIARGRMEAGVVGIEKDSWVVTLGQHLLSEEAPTARVRPVNWGWVEQLQNLQKEDLMQALMEQQKTGTTDSTQKANTTN